MRSCKIWGVFSLKQPHNGMEWAITSHNKMLINSETARETRNMSMNHDYKTGVALSDSVKKTFVKLPLAEKSR